MTLSLATDGASSRRVAWRRRSAIPLSVREMGICIALRVGGVINAARLAASLLFIVPGSWPTMRATG